MALFDLEIQKVSELTTAGVKKISDIFYGVTELVSHASWDRALPVDGTFYKSLYPLTSRYQKLKNVGITSFVSHVDGISGFEIMKLLVKRGSTIPLWRSGIASFFRMRVRVSNNNFRELATYDSDFDRYYQPIGKFVASVNIDVTTNKISSNIADVCKDFKMTPMISTVKFVDTLPSSAQQYTIFVVKDVNGDPDKLYCARYNSQIVFIGSIDHVGDWKEFDKSTCVTGQVFYDITTNKVFIREEGKFVDYQHKLSFLASMEDFNYIIEKDPYDINGLDTIYLSNFKRVYTDVEIGIIDSATGIIAKRKYFTVPEYPFDLNSLKLYQMNDDGSETLISSSNTNSLAGSTGGSVTVSPPYLETSIMLAGQSNGWSTATLAIGMIPLSGKASGWSSSVGSLSVPPVFSASLTASSNAFGTLTSVQPSFKVIKNVILVVNPLVYKLRIKIDFDIIPIVSFDRDVWSPEKDARHFLADFSPNIISFTNGAICLFGKESDMSLSPATLTISTNKDPEPVINDDGTIFKGNPILEALGNLRVTATLRNENGVPLSGRKVSLNILDDEFHMAKWAGDDDQSFQAKTNMAGEINGTILNAQMKYGWCLQKEWAGDVVLSADKRFMMYDQKGVPLREEGTRNRLYVPFEIGATDPNKIFLYMITADDPILGMVAAYWNTQTGKYVEDKSFTGQKVKEFYGRSGQLSSYELVARKIAHVAIMSGVSNDNTISIETRFKKPKSIVKITGKEIITRNSIIYSRELEGGDKIGAINLLQKYNTSTEENDFQVIAGMEPFYIERYGWDNRWLLSGEENKISFIRVKPTTCNYLEFEGEVPGIDDPNVIGYFMITDLGGKVSVQATYTDELTQDRIDSSIKQIDLESYIKSESAFTLAENAPEGTKINNFLGTFGYLSISDYIKSPFGINSCSIICKYSNGDKKCIKESLRDEHDVVLKSYRDEHWIAEPNFGGMWCAHNPDFDSDPDNIPCPGLIPKLVNPFLLHIAKS